MPPIDENEFAAFAASGEVKVGESNLASQEAAPVTEKRARRNPPKPAAEQIVENAAQTGDEGGENNGGDLDDDDQGGAANEEGERPRETPESRTKRLQRERAQARQEVRDLKAQLAARDNTDISARLAALEKGGLPQRQSGDTEVSKLAAAPDVNDLVKYPLGYLDAQYSEDRIDWLTDKKLAERADAATHRQRENQETQAATAEQKRTAEAYTTLMAAGEADYDDYHEVTMEQQWALNKPTFDAASEVEHGAQILYELAKDPEEAKRVFDLSAAKQAVYVDKKNDEIAAKKTPRRIPNAGDPPRNKPNGGNSRTTIDPATDNLDDFEKAVRQDVMKSRR